MNLSNIQSIKLYYGGTEARQNYGKELYLPVTYISRDVSGKTLAANPSYSINKSQVNNPGRKVILNANQKLFPGINYFWISLQMKPGASLLDKVSAKIVTVKVDNKEALIYTVSPENITHRVGVGYAMPVMMVRLLSVFRDWQLLIKEHCWEFMMYVIIAVLICRNTWTSV